MGVVNELPFGQKDHLDPLRAGSHGATTCCTLGKLHAASPVLSVVSHASSRVNIAAFRAAGIALPPNPVVSRFRLGEEGNPNPILPEVLAVVLAALKGRATST